MFITRVELENIKSYRHASVELRRGTTAIRGQNGAGKTTLVEAIGFALFDYLPYNQAQFVREGERSGQVTVTFKSGVDDVEYAVVRRCGTPSAWYVYDPQIDKRLVEQKADVIDWLREHLPLQGEIELGAFFSDALGVQQGTFTSDFLAAPAIRKRKFDALLQIEDYRKAFEKLRDTQSHLQQSAHEADLRVQALETETAHVAVWRDELAAQRDELDAGTGRLFALEDEREQAEQQRAAFDRLEKEIEKLASDAAAAEGKWELAKQTLDQATHDLDEAQAAQRTLEANAEDYTLYQESQVALQVAYAQQRIQQDLRERQAVQQRERATAQANAQHAEVQLAQASEAQRKLKMLAPLVKEQARLEQQISVAQQQIKHLLDVEQVHMRLEADCARLAEEVTKQAQRIAEIETQRAEAALLAERRDEVERLSLEVKRRSDWERELPEVRGSLDGAEAQRQKADAAVMKRKADVDKLLANQAVVATLPKLEREWNELRQQVMLLTGNIKRHNESKLQSAGGHCPFLKEPCLNIRQKGMLSLETYFDGLIARDQAALVPLEAREAALDQQVQDVRLKKSYVDRLDEYEQRLLEARDQQEHLRQEMQRLKTREQELVTQLNAASKNAAKLPQAQALLQRSDDADKEVRMLAGLLSQHESAQRHLDGQRQRLEQLSTERLELAGAPAREAEASQQLSALGDPRREYAQQEGIAAQEEGARELLQSASLQVSLADEAFADLEVQLAPYIGLDERIMQLNQQTQQSRSGYQTYLTYEQMAGKTPERQRAHDAALKAARLAHECYARARQQHATKAASYDPQALVEARQRVEYLVGAWAELREKLRGLREEIGKKEQQIAAVQEKLAELDAAKAERAELGETREMLQQFRETIRDAGPHVMKELLKQISKGANRIFGDILGDRSVELSWEEDYEIVLRTRGQERSFAQLSGGEQMSAALAVRLALLKTLAKLDVAFFDEPTQSMDETRRGNLAEQIRRVRGFNQLIVISHDDTFEQGLDSVIYLQKRDGETVIGDADMALAGSLVEIGIDGAGDY
ncbi:MAG TPA: SMC family ATPase [Ktedonobacterales bacterium]|nr:SMC family ATPase [Ktedonobacterales bacterium]